MIYLETLDVVLGGVGRWKPTPHETSKASDRVVWELPKQIKSHRELFQKFAFKIPLLILFL